MRRAVGFILVRHRRWLATMMVSPSHHIIITIRMTQRRLNISHVEGKRLLI